MTTLSRLNTVSFAIAGLCFGLVLTSRSYGQTPALTDPDFAAKLVKRLDELELKAKRVDELEAEIKILKTASSNMETPLASPVASYPEIRLSILTDVTFHASSDHNDKNTFALGDVDPIITAKLSEKASVLADFVVSSDNNGFGFEIERLLLQYNVNDYFHVEAGRFHTAIGYYNNTFHNGTYFQTTTERPEIYLFEDGEGILPVHSNGISINGDIPSGALRLHYVAELANGRDYNSGINPFRVNDNNSLKALNFALSSKPEGLPGLQIGGSAYHDTLSLDGSSDIDQFIFSAYAVYRTASFEWLNEGVFMRNAPDKDRAYWTSAAYTQISQKYGKLRPYLRLQWRNSPEGDPVLAAIGQDTLVWGPTAGVRYDFVPMMALKAEYQHTERRDESALDELTLQWATRF